MAAFIPQGLRKRRNVGWWAATAQRSFEVTQRH